jgi:predicted dehydrogenase
MIRWGVLGPGGIAVKFAESMKLVEGGRIVAVASRSRERAVQFGDQFEVEARYGDYESLAGDPNVDIVYVATPHAMHERDTLMMLGAGKHVLCEKPLALNAKQADRMVHEARASRLFLMEAIWSRFLPAYRVLTDLISSGEVGDVLLVESDFGFRLPVDPAHRLYNLALGGGALLDLGIYPIQLCSLLLGKPVRVQADGIIGGTGVDEVVAAVLSFDGGRMGVIKAAIQVGLSCTARISGSVGAIALPAPMHCPRSVSVISNHGDREVDCSFPGNGLQFEIEEVHQCLREELTESQTMRLDDTVAFASTLDVVRSQIGLVYPGE